MPSANPRVTVIMATWNWSEVLPFAIGSVLLQTFGDFELLVVGDGCTDDSERVVADIGDPRVRWLNLPENHGHQSAPNNEGLRQARGELVAYLGHDDLWLPHHLDCLVKAIEEGADLAHGIVRMVAPGDEQACLIRSNYVPGDWIPPSSVVHRRALVTAAGGWADYRTLSCDPDGELWRRFHAAGARIRFVPRLTAIKLPAAARRIVYKKRPWREQAAWLERIRSTDVEAEELGALLVDAEARAAPKPFRALLGEVARRGAASLRARLRPKPAPQGPGEDLDRRRRYKGLDSRTGNAAGPPGPRAAASGALE
ncbi:MAG TPA: glycosyltransferase [Allosphingosinicella sp.]|jgi:glycosyltransferase involved in cell wall biosynthesis